MDVGAGVRTFDVVARRAGRRVEISTSRAVLEVTEVTRTGTVVRTARFMTSRVVAVVEHPALDDERAGPLVPHDNPARAPRRTDR